MISIVAPHDRSYPRSSILISFVKIYLNYKHFPWISDISNSQMMMLTILFLLLSTFHQFKLSLFKTANYCLAISQVVFTIRAHSLTNPTFLIRGVVFSCILHGFELRSCPSLKLLSPRYKYKVNTTSLAEIWTHLAKFTFHAANFCVTDTSTVCYVTGYVI